MSERELTLTAGDRGSLVLADISGYTAYLLGTELEHAQDVLSDLLRAVVELARREPRARSGRRF